MGKIDVLERVSGGNAIGASQEEPRSVASSLRSKQCEKIAELKQALIDAGIQTLDEQAAALNLSRSTAWAVLQGNYKGSGLSAKIIKRILASPQLPTEARAILAEYVKQKLAGSFGHSKTITSRFRMRILEQGQIGRS